MLQLMGTFIKKCDFLILFNRLQIIITYFKFLFILEIPAYPDQASYMAKLTIAVLGPVFSLGIIGAIVILYMRRKHRKRLRSHMDADTYYAPDDLLHSAMGEVSLRFYLSLNIFNSICLLIFFLFLY